MTIAIGNNWKVVTDHDKYQWNRHVGIMFGATPGFTG